MVYQIHDQILIRFKKNHENFFSITKWNLSQQMKFQLTKQKQMNSFRKVVFEKKIIQILYTSVQSITRVATHE